MTDREQPDTIWTYDKRGNCLYGRPNFDKPGVAERVEREAFENEANSLSMIGVGLRMRIIRQNRFEEELAARKAKGEL